MTNTNWNSVSTITLPEYNKACDVTINDELLSIDTSSMEDITITIDENTHWSDHITLEQTEFVDTMPSIDKIHNMVGYYPALEKAYENFKTIYKMVEQDYKGNHQENDELPF